MTANQIEKPGEGTAPSGNWVEVLAVFLRLGLTSFGGPIAHLGYFRAELVVKRKWLADATALLLQNWEGWDLPVTRGFATALLLNAYYAFPKSSRSSRRPAREVAVTDSQAPVARWSPSQSATTASIEASKTMARWHAANLTPESDSKADVTGACDHFSK